MSPTKYDVTAAYRLCQDFVPPDGTATGSTAESLVLYSKCSKRFLGITHDNKVQAFDNSGSGNFPIKITSPPDFVDGPLKLALHFELANVYICFNTRWRIVTSTTLHDRCYFYETMANGWFQYQSAVNPKKFLAFNGGGRQQLTNSKQRQDKQCLLFEKLAAPPKSASSQPTSSSTSRSTAASSSSSSTAVATPTTGRTTTQLAARGRHQAHHQRDAKRLHHQRLRQQHQQMIAAEEHEQFLQHHHEKPTTTSATATTTSRTVAGVTRLQQHVFGATSQKTPAYQTMTPSAAKSMAAGRKKRPHPKLRRKLPATQLAAAKTPTAAVAAAATISSAAVGMLADDPSTATNGHHHHHQHHRLQHLDQKQNMLDADVSASDDLMVAAASSNSPVYRPFADKPSPMKSTVVGVKRSIGNKLGSRAGSSSSSSSDGSSNISNISHNNNSSSSRSKSIIKSVSNSDSNSASSLSHREHSSLSGSSRSALASNHNRTNNGVQHPPKMRHTKSHPKKVYIGA